MMKFSLLLLFPRVTKTDYFYPLDAMLTQYAVAMAPCLFMSVYVCRKSVFSQNSSMDLELVFRAKASFDLFYTVL